MKKRKTIFAKNEDIKRDRFVVDASGKVLGRLATKVASYLRGKHRTIFTPQTDCGDYIVIVNADKIMVTGQKIKQKTYFTHSGYPAGDKLFNFEKMIATRPEKVVQLAIAGMIPHNRLGAKMLKKLRVFKGEKPEYSKWQKLEV
jgi:large subunit ribosomal protein L13